jgi:hypothetical protein
MGSERYASAAARPATAAYQAASQIPGAFDDVTSSCLAAHVSLDRTGDEALLVCPVVHRFMFLRIDGLCD